VHKDINPVVLSCRVLYYQGVHDEQGKEPWRRYHFGVILGPSGSGKSTLLNIIGGIDRCDSGSVSVDDIAVTKLSDNKLTDYRREKIGFVFQFYNLIPNLTAGENIEVVSNISKAPLPVDEVLDAVGMMDKKYRFPKELSGGFYDFKGNIEAFAEGQ
jgi:ABC-type lipoprotein export system ATPase subunit